MKEKLPGQWGFILAILISAAVCIVAPAMAATSADQTATSADQAAASVAVTNVTIEPTVFMQGDTGTITVTIVNSGTQAVSISRAEILSSDVNVLNYQTYESVGSIGPGNTMKFTFYIQAGNVDGTYFPMFYLGFTGAGSLRYPLALKVADTPLTVSVVDAPDTFSAGAKDTVTLAVSNPRPNMVNGVTVTPTGAGIKTTQSSIFLGTLNPDESRQVHIDVTPEGATTLAFDVSYRNGLNEHHVTLDLPVTVGGRVTAAELVVNNIEISQSGAVATLSADITNAGLADAKSVKVTVGAPATPVDPNPVYVVGALQPDDFSSFELTFTTRGASTVPLIIDYLDDQGKVFSKTLDISLDGPASSSAGSSGSSFSQGSAPGMRGPGGGFFGFGSGIGRIPWTQIIVIIVVAIALLVAWRKGYLARGLDKVRSRKQE